MSLPQEVKESPRGLQHADVPFINGFQGEPEEVNSTLTQLIVLQKKPNDSSIHLVYVVRQSRSCQPGITVTGCLASKSNPVYLRAWSLPVQGFWSEDIVHVTTGGPMESYMSIIDGRWLVNRSC